MNKAPPPAADPVGRLEPLSAEPVSVEVPLYAAVDLGTNNCRLLIATPSLGGFRVIESYSRIVRLGEGLSQSGRLADGAMDRAMAALRICAEKIKRRRTLRVKAIATQACRSASNGAEFVERVAKETGIRLQVISPREEAQLSVAGCLNLFDRDSLAALVIDVGGGSTELSWVDLTDKALDVRARDFVPSALPIRAWISLPVGVVSLAERFPERPDQGEAWFRSMVEDVKVRIAAFTQADPMRPIFDSGQAHLVGTSGAITGIAGLHLGLRRYDRTQIDGLWMRRQDCEVATMSLLKQLPSERAAQPCIGPDRADLVLAGAAILQAVQEVWPCDRVRVADRGLREGLLLTLMSDKNRKKRPRRRRSRHGKAVQVG